MLGESCLLGLALGWIGLALNTALLTLGVYFVLGIVVPGIRGGIL